MIRKTLSNNNGLLTLDFIFATIVILGFSAIIFSFAVTLSVVEVVQYISFASARNFSLAHLDEKKQLDRGKLKYQELVTNPVVRPFLENRWFVVGEVEIADFNGEFAPTPSLDSDTFVGSRIPFSAPILYKRIPFIGTTASNPEGFTAKIQSFLMREPTFRECEDFITQRGQQVNSLGFNFQPGDYVVLMDNGC